MGDDPRLYGRGGDSGGGGGGGAVGVAKAINVNQKELFAPSLTVEFVEDSPFFRRKVEALDSNVEGEIKPSRQQGVAASLGVSG